MSDPTIICPQCKAEVRLTESLAAPLLESARRDLEEKFAKREADYLKRETLIRQMQSEVAREREVLDDQVAAKLKAERQRIVEQEARKARDGLAEELALRDREKEELMRVLKERDTKLAEAQKAQATLIRRERELADARREMELTIEKKVHETLNNARQQARKEAEETFKLKLSEAEIHMASMQRQIEELKRRAEQGSQQLQGEAQELELQHMLATQFPNDLFEPVAKGEHGGDLLQRVVGPSGKVCGTILWESKRTKKFSDSWLGKLRGDQRVAHAEVAALATQALPEGVETFAEINGVWVTAFRCVPPVSAVLRQQLIQVAAIRLSQKGQQTKMELMYQYLTGSGFRHRIQAVVEHFSQMQADLDKERKATMKMWAKRETQIRGVIDSTAGLYGDLQGIAGQSLKEIQGLDYPALPADASDTEITT